MHRLRVPSNTQQFLLHFLMATLLVVSLLSPISHAEPIIGADLSFLPKVEQNGGLFRMDGQTEEALEIFRAGGYSFVRLRLWHNPAEPWNGIDSTLAMAVRASAMGYDIMLDFHFSDSWADPGQQTKPAAWQGLEFNLLCDSVYSYTNHVISRFREMDILPRWVQLGNEISGGMLWPDGKVGGAYDTPLQWQQLGTLLDHAARGVLDSLSMQDRPELIIHYDNGADNMGCRWFFDSLHNEAGFRDYNIIGLSYYPWWHGTLEELEDNLNDLGQRYGKDLFIVEMDYPWTLGWNDDDHNMVGMEEQLLAGFPATPQGQWEFYMYLFSIIRRVPESRGIGMCSWEPDWISTPTFGSGMENLCPFDFNGNALPALFAFSELGIPEQNPGIDVALPAEYGGSIYPNPTNGASTLFFRTTEAGSFQISLFTLLGQLVYQDSPFPVSAGTYQVPLTDLPASSGCYFLRITRDRVPIMTTRLIVIE